MAPRPLERLKNGLLKLKKQVEEKRKALQAKLANREKISEADEGWLDNEANLLNEEQLVDELENASDYERGVGRLDDAKKALRHRLIGTPVVSNKRKRKLMSSQVNFSVKISLVLNHRSRAKT